MIDDTPPIAASVAGPADAVPGRPSGRDRPNRRRIGVWSVGAAVATGFAGTDAFSRAPPPRP